MSTLHLHIYCLNIYPSIIYTKLCSSSVPTSHRRFVIFFYLWLVPDAPALLADASMNIGRPSRRSSLWGIWIYYCQLWDYQSMFNTISLSFPFHRRLTPVWTSDITRREWLRLQLNHFRLFADVAKTAKQAYLWITHKTQWRASSPLWRASGLVTSYIMT